MLKQCLVAFAFLAIFSMAGYATGKMKHRFTAIACLITIASIPFLLRYPVWKIVGLLSVAICPILFSGFSIAGYVMGKKANSRSVLLARAAICTCLLIVPVYVVLRWGYMTRMIDVGFQHQEHIRVGHWEFPLPDRWYTDRAPLSFWYDMGAQEALELRRTSWSVPKAQSVILIVTPVPSKLHLNDKLTVNERFRIANEYGRCSLTTSDQKELHYHQWCQFPDADLVIDIEARTEEDLLEAARIVSGARFLKLSDPYSSRQPS